MYLLSSHTPQAVRNWSIMCQHQFLLCIFIRNEMGTLTDCVGCPCHCYANRHKLPAVFNCM